MKAAFGVLALSAAASAHMCMFQPSMRPDADGILTEAEFANFPGANDKCRRNVNLTPFDNMASPVNGSVCGGSANHQGNQDPLNAWNLAITPPAGNVFTGGSTATIQWLEDAAHPDPRGARSSYHYLSYASTPNPTSNDEFVPVAIIVSDEIADSQYTFSWDIPSDVSFDAGVFRVVYLSAAEATEGLLPDPTEGGVSNTYSSCGDIRINADPNAPSSASVATASVTLAAAAAAALF